MMKFDEAAAVVTWIDFELEEVKSCMAGRMDGEMQKQVYGHVTAIKNWRGISPFILNITPTF